MMGKGVSVREGSLDSGGHGAGINLICCRFTDTHRKTHTDRQTDTHTDRMDVKLLCLTVVLLSSPLLTLCEPLFVLSAPNLLRVGSPENVLVEAQDYSGADFDVQISVNIFPKKDNLILTKTVTLTGDNNYQILTDIKIPDDLNFFSGDPLEKQYVYLQAQFPSETLEKVVMVSFQSGYIFIQTDKPIYTPASTVYYRIFSLAPNMKPHSQTGVTVEIMNPQGITVSSQKMFTYRFTDRGMKSGYYPIPEVASTGMWKVVTRFINTPQKKFTADFEVKEYVLPTFEVKLKPSRSFFYVDDQSLTVDIEAKNTSVLKKKRLRMSTLLINSAEGSSENNGTLAPSLSTDVIGSFHKSGSATPSINAEVYH